MSELMIQFSRYTENISLLLVPILLVPSTSTNDTAIDGTCFKMIIDFGFMYLSMPMLDIFI